MNIQSNINQTLSIAGMLMSQTPMAAAAKEKELDKMKTKQAHQRYNKAVETAEQAIPEGKTPTEADYKIYEMAEGAATEEPVAEAKPAFDSAILFDEAQLVAAAYALADGESIPTPAVLKGAITEIGTPYSAEYKNVTVTIKAADKDIVCFRLKGEGADKLAEGDEIVAVYEYCNLHNLWKA